MPPYNDGSVVLEDVRIIFRNFEGKEGDYNREGDRNFGVILSDELAHAMERDNWNIKWLKPREEDDPPQGWLPVSIKYGKGRPPKVTLITSKGRTSIGEEEIETLDWVDIRKVDLIIRPYNWTVTGKSGIKAYLKSLFVTIEEDFLDLKYADLEDLPARAGRVDE